MLYIDNVNQGTFIPGSACAIVIGNTRATCDSTGVGASDNTEPETSCVNKRNYHYKTTF
jgi:hypothetical protein